jgi:hypothetical protein
VLIEIGCVERDIAIASAEQAELRQMSSI